MCRAAHETADNKPLRCEKCNNPEVRRSRQNLAYAVNKEKSATETSEASSSVDTKEPTTLAEALAQEAKTSGFEEFDEAKIAETMASMLADPKVAKAVAEDLRKDRENAENNKVWLLNGREDTPENLAAGVAERQEQILLVGTVIAERAQAIHGIDVDEARAEWSQRLEGAQKEYEAQRKITDEATNEFHRRRREMAEEKDVHIFNLANNMTDEEKAEISALSDAKMAANRESMVKHLLVQEIMIGKDKETLATLEKISEGNRKAIAEVREMGTESTEFRNAIRGGGKVGETFNSVVGETFPADWVKKSNALGNLALKRANSTTGRAHYKSVSDNTNGGAEFRYSMKRKPDFRDDRYHDWTERKDENGNPTGVWHGPHRDFLQERSIYNYKKYDGDKPKGAGWKRGKAVAASGNVVTGWVRDNATDAKHRKAKTENEAEITVYMNQSDQETRRVITHEFAHRIEDAVPHIPMLEEGFLASRTTMENGKREPLRAYKGGSVGGVILRHDGKREAVREDNFISPYMGKEYTDNFREVLSMGSESVFSGSNGGLVGIGNAKTDHQMRNWILGVYATM